MEKNTDKSGLEYIELGKIEKIGPFGKKDLKPLKVDSLINAITGEKVKLKDLPPQEEDD